MIEVEAMEGTETKTGGDTGHVTVQDHGIVQEIETGSGGVDQGSVRGTEGDQSDVGGGPAGQ